MDCWSVPNFMLIIDYTWHPIYPHKSDEQLKRSCEFIHVLNQLHTVALSETI